MWWKVLLVVVGLAATSSVVAASPRLSFVPGSTTKLYQVTGDCDWESWDATISDPKPKCVPTRSQTASRADVLGDDVPVVFEDKGELIITLGDTFGASSERDPKWIQFENPFEWKSQDPIGHSSTLKATDQLLIDFFMDGDHALVVHPIQPDHQPVEMGADDVPSAGIEIDGQMYLAVTTGSTKVQKGEIDRSEDYSLLVKADPDSKSFASGRRISGPPYAYFARPIFKLGPPDTANPGGTPAGPPVWMFGVGRSAQGVYLASTPAADFWTGTDPNGKPATQYFASLGQSGPNWTQTEDGAHPIVTAPDPANPGIPYATVSYADALKLWIMIFDNSGKGPESGMYMTYASFPWGPWSQPQQIFNACRDKGFGHFMFYYYASPADDGCPSAMPPCPPKAGSAGPAGPTAGDQAKNVATTTPGIAYGPAIVDRFTTIEGDTLRLYFLMSTWNPYAVVMMQSEFRISDASGPPDKQGRAVSKPNIDAPPAAVEASNSCPILPAPRGAPGGGPGTRQPRPGKGVQRLQ